MLYMATGKPAHLGCKFLLYVSVVNSPIVVELLVIIFVIPNGRIRLIQLRLGVLILVSQFRLLGVDEFNDYQQFHNDRTIYY